MYILIGVGIAVALIVFVVKWMTAKEYHVVRLKFGKGLVYSDDSIEAEFFKGQAENGRIDFYSDRGITIKLRNKANAAMTLKWDSSLFIYPDGKSVQLVTGKEPIGAQREVETQPLPVAPNSYVEKFACPRDKFEADVSRLHDVLFRGETPENFEFGCILAVNLNGVAKNYDFRFEVMKQK